MGGGFCNAGGGVINVNRPHAPAAPSEAINEANRLISDPALHWNVLDPPQSQEWVSVTPALMGLFK